MEVVRHVIVFEFEMHILSRCSGLYVELQILDKVHCLSRHRLVDLIKLQKKYEELLERKCRKRSCGQFQSRKAVGRRHWLTMQRRVRGEVEVD